MNIRQSVFGEIAIRSVSGGKVSGIDSGTLLRRLLLFDRVIVKSVGLYEISHLVRLFGKSGFLNLLQSDALKISSEFIFVLMPKENNGKRVHPYCHFSFGTGEIQNREKSLRRGLVSLQGVSGLKNVERESLEDAVLAGLVRPPASYAPELLTQFEQDLRKNSPALRAAIEQQLKNHATLCEEGLEVEVAEVNTRLFHVKTNIPQLYGLSEEQTDALLHTSVFGVANLNGRIADMQAYSALSCFSEEEAPLLFGKFAGIISPHNPKLFEKQFTRVLNIAHLPDIQASTKIDVDKLLAARESSECAEFRSWIAKLDSVSDEQIEQMVEGVRSKIGSALHGGTGKTLRLAATTLLGLIPVYGGVTGAAAGALDTFLVDKLFPSSGVGAFLSKTYPSLFDEPEDQKP